MFDWMNALPSDGPGSLAYHAYFDEDSPNDGAHALEHFPESQLRFRTLFGSAPELVQPLPIRRATVRPGYSMLGADGAVYAFGAARAAGNAPGPATAIAARPRGTGYWVVDAAGDVAGFGSAAGYGGHPALRADEWVSAISSTPTGHGYWLFTIRGRVFAYGDARSYGDLGGRDLNGPVVASVATPTGHGYYMVGSDGGVFGFGDARFRGSMGNARLNRPIVGLAPTPDGRGYWLVASDGGVFAFGRPVPRLDGWHDARAGGPGSRRLRQRLPDGRLRRRGLRLLRRSVRRQSRQPPAPAPHHRHHRRPPLKVHQQLSEISAPGAEKSDNCWWRKPRPEPYLKRRRKRVYATGPARIGSQYDARR